MEKSAGRPAFSLKSIGDGGKIVERKVAEKRRM